MSLIKETHKAIIEACDEAKQIEFKNTLVNYMEELIKGNLDAKDKDLFAESLLNSYKKELIDED
jgi:hypothetical protein